MQTLLILLMKLPHIFTHKRSLIRPCDEDRENYLICSLKFVQFFFLRFTFEPGRDNYSLCADMFVKV